MFYSTEILNRRGGRFALIWLAATKGRKLSRREVCGVDLVDTCHAILKYLRAKTVRQRLSLYLSTQLMYGTLVIYQRQSSVLLDEVNSLFIQFRSLRVVHNPIELQSIPLRDRVTRSDILTDMDLGFRQFKDVMIDIEEIPTVVSTNHYSVVLVFVVQCEVWSRDISFEMPLQSDYTVSIQKEPSTPSPPSLTSKSKPGNFSLFPHSCT
ncbi:meiotic recombination protein REC8 homolog [Octopus sinensis]|uniref:Meiotic recombination protein REC8 homolog n=1 Tax=Octopus sinensis TaxID=2607531 RepID=A0A7E6FC06_9MOLL|nr:meiotic recombination protein REC8 homolog [Octopus sinensis]